MLIGLEITARCFMNGNREAGLANMTEKPFNLVAVGGSFDHLHDGHRALLRSAVLLGTKVAIGLTTDELLRHKKYYDRIQTYEERTRGIVDFMCELGHDDYEIIPLSNPYGATITQYELDALVVSSETHNKNVEQINRIREEKGFKPLVLIVIPVVKNGCGGKLSSTDIREALH